MKKTVRLKVINKFYDSKTDTKRFKNDEFETNEKRAKEILAYDKYQLVEIQCIITE
jgi:hypothetical protein